MSVRGMKQRTRGRKLQNTSEATISKAGHHSFYLQQPEVPLSRGGAEHLSSLPLRPPERMERGHLHARFPAFILLLALLLSSPAISAKSIRRAQPCRSLVLFFHDIIYNGKNAANATSAIVAAPAWANRINLAPMFRFGDIVVFDGPVTLDNNFHSPRVGRAQGLYLYDGKTILTAWLGFSLALNSTDYKGTINLVGADPIMNLTRDISVVGGTGDFFMTRGIATVMTDAFEDTAYFRLRLDIKLYECY